MGDGDRRRTPRPLATLAATGPSAGPAAIMAGPSEEGRVVVRRRVAEPAGGMASSLTAPFLGAVRQLSALMADERDDFARRRRNFRWRLPERFNIGVAVCDAWALRDPGRVAILHKAAGTSPTRQSPMAR